MLTRLLHAARYIHEHCICPQIFTCRVSPLPKVARLEARARTDCWREIRLEDVRLAGALREVALAMVYDRRQPPA